MTKLYWILSLLMLGIVLSSCGGKAAGEDVSTVATPYIPFSETAWSAYVPEIPAGTTRCLGMIMAGPQMSQDGHLHRYAGIMYTVVKDELLWVVDVPVGLYTPETGTYDDEVDPSYTYTKLDRLPQVGDVLCLKGREKGVEIVQE